MLVLAGKQAQPPTPPHHPIAVVMQPHFLPSVPLLLTQSCWQQNMLPLVLLCLITSCVGCGGHRVHVQLCTCIVAYNKVVCACSEPALHTLFILCVWLCCKFVCPRCPWRSILCILSLMKAPKRERGAYGGGGGIGGGVKASVFSCGHFTITKLTRVRWAMARQQGDQSAATSIRTNCPDYTAAIS